MVPRLHKTLKVAHGNVTIIFTTKHGR